VERLGHRRHAHPAIATAPSTDATTAAANHRGR
jgi:hypothetical protein